ncbi:short aerial hyphae-3 [Trichoderma harzianum]|uniref:Short aerial hyphae-3 n=1 Tax=Trichoderma harzianum TaxID=5544 RepID=A0A0F9XIG4_TRIHA|nr:short aerial hyphae-3 [Trichoderma harzianum]
MDSQSERRTTRKKTVAQEEVDRILRLRKRQRDSKACYPCRLRKVKCDSKSPCKTCEKRGHPEICVYTNFRQESDRKSSDRASTPHSERQPEIDESASSHRISTNYPTIHGNFNSHLVSSGNTAAVIVRLQKREGESSTQDDVEQMLGLQNTYRDYPFMKVKSAQGRWASLLEILPQKEEVLKYFHLYRVFVFPFNPILADINDFELELRFYLKSLDTGELSDPLKESHHWTHDKYLGLIGLILATMASGVQFSDLSHVSRAHISRDLIRRALQSLRLANYLCRPTVQAIQTLLIIGNVLQNNGQSDAASALLGCTIRLGQALRLDIDDSSSSASSSDAKTVKTTKRKTWLSIVWQDSLLSLCHGRLPAALSRSGYSFESLLLHKSLSFIEAMHYICQLAMVILERHETVRSQIALSMQWLTILDRIRDSAQPHLRNQNQCENMQECLHFLAFRLNTSFLETVICRPALGKACRDTNTSEHERARMRAKESFTNALQAFLEFHTLSIVPLRTWSTIHTTLSSILLTSIWEETKNDPVFLDLQQRTIHIFESAGSSPDAADRTTVHNSQWLSEPHIQLLKTVKNVVRQNAARNFVSGDDHNGPLNPPPGSEDESVVFPTTETVDDWDTYFPELLNDLDIFPISNLVMDMNT